MSFTNSDLPVVLSVSGSDSGAGSGIQADLKTFNNLGVFGVTAITCITAQTPAEIRSISPVAPDLVHEQIRAVSDGFPIAAAKTGMLYNRDIILAVARADISQGIPILVVDPEIVTSSSGARLLQPDAIEALRAELLPLARVVTPNVQEAEILSGMKITSVEELAKAARAISELFDIACVAKGGSLQGDTKVDVLCDEGKLSSSAPRAWTRRDPRRRLRLLRGPGRLPGQGRADGRGGFQGQAVRGARPAGRPRGRPPPPAQPRRT
ncbi:MAG: hydroxymethylpyrimidine/phosphomethylpyrimidine kinase [Kiritimatiellia bacterium]